MYLLTRILFLSWLMTHLLKQIPTCFMVKLFSRKSLIYQNLPSEPEMQSPDPSHKRTRSTWSWSSQEPQSLPCTAEKAWISRQNTQNCKLKSSVGNHNLKWKPNPWQAEKAETEIGCVEKVLHASRQCNWCSTWDRRISVVSSWDSSYWIWLVVLLAEGEVLKGKNTD